MRKSITSKQIQINKINKKKDEFYKSLLGFWCLILTLLGIPWIIGYFILDSRKTLVFSYIFTILNSSQGTIIFIFHCLLSKNVRDEMIKQVRKQIRRLFSSLEVGSKSGSGGGFSSINSNKFLKKGHIYTSSLKNTEKINEINRASTSSSSSSNSHINNKFWLIRHIYNLIKSPKSSNLLSYSSTIDSNKHPKNGNNVKMTPLSLNDTNRSNESPIIYFNNPNRCNLENFQNQSAILINDDDGCSANLIPTDNKYYITCKKISNKNHTLNTKSLIPLMYFSNENHSQSFIGNLIQIPYLNSTTLNRKDSYLKRTFSSLNNSNNSANQDVNNQTPILPPSLPPPLIYKNYYNLDIPITNNIESNYNDNENRFSTFKSNKNSANLINIKKHTNSNTIKSINLNFNDNFSKRLYTNYDENQYLTPECSENVYHSYSIVDCKNLNESKIANENDDEIEGDLSNNYVEVLDEYYDSNQCSNKMITNSNKLEILSRIKDNFLERNYFNKSDDQLFKIASSTTRIDEINEKKINLLNKGLMAKTSSSLETSSPSSSYSSSSSDSSIGHQNIDSLNYNHQIIVKPNENLKAKKLLQRI